MTDEELREHILLQRMEWELYARAQQKKMRELVDVYGTVEDPVNPGFFVLDRAHRIMKGLCRLDRRYTLHQTRVLQKMVAKLAEWLETNPDELEWW